jgi:hypothetical protein
MVVNPSGVPAPVMGLVPPPQEIDPPTVLCGDLNFDGINGGAAQRWDSLGLSSWLMINCEFDQEMEIQGFNWVTVDTGDANWLQRDDFAIWNAATVEPPGCAGDQGDVANGRDLSNSREGPLGQLFGLNIWKYHLTLPDPVTLPAGKYYFGVRIVSEGQSFILTTFCTGQKPAYFQSDFFGFPCAVNASAIFGADSCVAIEVLGKPAGPPVDKCIYQVNSVKIKKDLCGNPSCTDCPYTLGDIICTHDCPPGCENALSGTSACPSGSICKVKAGSMGCGPCPRGSKRCR